MKKQEALKDYFSQFSSKNERNVREISEPKTAPRYKHRHSNSFHIGSPHKSRIKILPAHLKNNFKGIFH